MASQPKRRRRTKSSAPAATSGPPPAVSPSNSIPQPNAPPTLQMEDMVQTCMSRLVPTIEDTFRQYMRDFHEQSAPPNEEPAPSLLQEITAPAVAAKKTVRVVSDTNYHTYGPENATDTVTICTKTRQNLHTKFTKNPWMEIVLGHLVDVSMVVIYNRQTKGGRFHNALIEVAENDVWRPCGFYKGPGVDYQIIFVICDETVRGDILKISLKSEPGERDVLNLCEVEVFERV